MSISRSMATISLLARLSPHNPGATGRGFPAIVSSLTLVTLGSSQLIRGTPPTADGGEAGARGWTADNGGGRKPNARCWSIAIILRAAASALIRLLVDPESIKTPVASLGALLNGLSFVLVGVGTCLNGFVPNNGLGGGRRPWLRCC